MPHDVIMPALGMAQDTGRIVAWLKAAGDAVRAGEPLFEVETDKATVEVEASHDGVLADVRAGEGDDVPVGDVVAVIAASAEEAGASTAPEPPPAPPSGQEAEAGGKDAPPAPAPAHDALAPAAERGEAARVLASPKARRLARERGIDLSRLVALGVPEPIHVADLDRAPVEAPDPRTAGAPAVAAAAACRIEARVPAAGFDEFLAWLDGECGRIHHKGAVTAAFAAAALRAATGAGESVTLRLCRPGHPDEILCDPDLSLAGAGRSQCAAPALVLRDLSATRIGGVRLGSPEAPVLSVARAGSDYAVTLEFAAGQMDDAVALALVDAFAQRLEMPLRMLLGAARADRSAAASDAPSR